LSRLFISTMADEGQTLPTIKRLKTTIARKDEGSTLEEVLPRIMEYVACFELSTVASVSKQWRSMASKSYHARVNLPWHKPLAANVFFFHPEMDQSIRYMIEGYKKLQQRQEIKWENKIYCSPNIYKEGANEWKFKTKAELAGDYDEKNPFKQGYFPGEKTCVNSSLEASILRMLPLEKDLPKPLLSNTNTKLEYCSMDRNGLLFLLLSHKWTPEYSEAIQKSLSLEDRYAYCAPRWRALEEEFGDDFDPVDLFLEEEEAANRPGSDIWGMLYAVESFVCTPGKDAAPKVQLVDTQRLCSEDFPNFFFGNAHRSENGKVICIETGVAKNQQQDRDSCTPTIRTFFLDKEGGIDCLSCEPMEWPIPDGLEDTFSSAIALSPGGDCMFCTYEDKGTIDGCAFYQYSKQATKWDKVWEGDDEQSFEGFYTTDGDFCISENGNSCTEAPGPMAAKRMLYLHPPPYWEPADAHKSAMTT